MSVGSRARPAAAAVAALWTLAAWGQQIDVSTLPPRESVQLTIYNSEDLTLVRETRRVTVQQGLNELQFSWANTLIDPTSVEIEFTSPGLTLVDTRYPHARPQTLYWLVESDASGEAAVGISYFTSGISWRADYVGVTNADESTMTLSGFVTITNLSGDDYSGAQIRLVVGTINLVEPIAELASNGIPDVAGTRGLAKKELKDASRRKYQWGRDHEGDHRDRDAATGGTGDVLGQIDAGPPEIVSEGLSEYFIFTVEGLHTVPNDWSRRLRFMQGIEVPMKIVHRFRPHEYGDALVKLFVVRNDAASSLGISPLPNGDVRLFRARDGGGLSVIAFLSTKYVPIGQEFEFNIGRDPQVFWERVTQRTWRDDFWFRRGAEQRLYSATRGDRVRSSDEVAGHGTHQSFVERIRNQGPRPVQVEFRFAIDGDVTFRSDMPATNFDFHTVEFGQSIGVSQAADLSYEVVRQEGTNAQESRVVIAPRQ